MTTRRAKLPRRTRGKVTSKKEAEYKSKNEKTYVNTNAELTFDVLTIIFKNLNAKDLYNAAIVCRSWNEAAESEKRVRGDATAVALLSNLDNSWTNREFIDLLRMKPMLSFMFTRPFDDRHPAKKENNADCPCRVLPSGCSNIIVGNYGLVKDNTELEDNSEKATWMLLPYDKDVTIETVYVPLDSNVINPMDKHLHNPKNLVKKLDKEKVKCFILLAVENYVHTPDIISKMHRDQERSFSGGVVCNLAICEKNENKEMCREPVAWIGIMISGPSVHSWSIVLKRSCNTKDKIIAKLKLLRNQVNLQKHSMGFMFACQGRGECMFKEKNIESTEFKKLFPEVPLIGSFGGGEYGNSTANFMSSRIHAYSTVFMIVTYG